MPKKKAVKKVEEKVDKDFGIYHIDTSKMTIDEAVKHQKFCANPECRSELGYGSVVENEYYRYCNPSCMSRGWR